MKTWFNVKAKADESVEVSIFDEIGMWGVTAKDFIDAIKQHAGKKLVCLINSPGGSVFDALAMYNALRAHGSEITTKAMGVAASAASIVFMAGDKRVMPENTFLMIHNPWAFAAGNAEELRDFADTLDTIGNSLVKTYVARTGMDEQAVRDLLAAETWLAAEDAVANGFADEMEPALKISASYDIDRLPDNVRAAFDAAASTTTVTETYEENTQVTKTTVIETDDPNGPAMQPEGEPKDALADQISDAVVAAGMQDHMSAFLLDDKINSMADAQIAIAQAREVRALCIAAKQPDMAGQLIAKKATLAEARAAIFDALATDDERTSVSSVQRNKQGQQTQASGASVWLKIFPPAAQSKGV